MPMKLKARQIVEENLTVVSTVFNFINIKVFLVLFLNIFFVNTLLAATMTCVIPKNSETSDPSAYIKLFEAKTIIEFNKNRNVTKFYSPGCNKFESISRWTNKLLIQCVSNNAELLKLKINTQTLNFTKNHSRKQGEHLILNGFCREATD